MVVDAGIIGILIIIIALIIFINRRFNQLEARNEVIYKWMFDAFYSLNHNVKLPDDKEPTYEEGTVFIDRTSVNRGEQDDWFGVTDD